MNFDLAKIKIPSFRLSKLNIFSVNPGDLWKKFIWFLIFFAIIIFLFSGWVYYNYYFYPDKGSDLNEVVLRTKSLEGAILRISEKRDRYKFIKENLLVEDPS